MRILTFLLALSALLSPASLFTPQQVNAGQYDDWRDYRLIAHAMGGIDGHTYTNSLDAFQENYRKGFRVFEVDLLRSTDDQLVARHDWSANMFKQLQQRNPGVKNLQPLSHDQFKTLPILKKYRPLDLDDILQLMERHPDMYLVTDTKSLNPTEIRNQFRILADKLSQVDPSVGRRIIPQLYNRQMYPLLEEIYPFESYIYTLYQSRDTDGQVLRFVQDTPKVKTVTMSTDRFSRSLALALNKLGIHTYVHTINKVSVYNDYRKKGAYGIYTDFLAIPQNVA